MKRWACLLAAAGMLSACSTAEQQEKSPPRVSTADRAACIPADSAPYAGFTYLTLRLGCSLKRFHEDWKRSRLPSLQEEPTWCPSITVAFVATRPVRIGAVQWTPKATFVSDHGVYCLDGLRGYTTASATVAARELHKLYGTPHKDAAGDNEWRRAGTTLTESLMPDGKVVIEFSHDTLSSLSCRLMAEELERKKNAGESFSPPSTLR
jgi:hypothetical protein